MCAPLSAFAAQEEAAGVGDALDRLAQLRTAVAALTAEHVPGQALAVRPDERCALARPGRESFGPIAEPEGEVLPGVYEPVETEHSSDGGLAVGEPQGHRELGPDRRSTQ